MEKLGRIFDPTDHRLPNGCVQFAQSPQALVFDDRVRVYFSTRAVDANNGKYLSHVAYVDFDKSMREVLRVSEKTVIPLGSLGSFDEHGIFPMSVMRPWRCNLWLYLRLEPPCLGVSRDVDRSGNQP